MTDDHPHRSMLYMPAANARALEKAKSLMADGFIFDLEDAVRPDAKVAARQSAVAAANSEDYPNRKILIRSNGLDTPWGEDDMTAIAGSAANGIVMPKVNGVPDIDRINARLASLGRPEGFEVWVMMETPAAFLNAAQIAASDGITGLIVGSNDLIKDLRARRTRDRAPVLWALSVAVMAARANSLVVLDAVYNDIRDEEGFRYECAQALDFGFDGKTLIHPSQIPPANEVFAPSQADIDHAERLIAAFEVAHTEGKGLATLDGQMVEDLHVAEARRLVGMASAIRKFEGRG